MLLYRGDGLDKLTRKGSFYGREREKKKKKSERTSEEKEKIENETKCFENLTVISLMNSKECRRGGEIVNGIKDGIRDELLRVYV